MPRRNSRTSDGAEDALGLHLYNRGRPGVAVFRSDEDRDQFMALLSRYLRGPLGDGVILVALCLMTTHFHLVVIDRVVGGTARLMHRLIAAYSIYYRRKYGGSGPLFDGPYRRNPILDSAQLRWTIGYVHDNHPSGLEYRYSSHRFYETGDAPSWIDVSSGLRAFGGLSPYLEFMRKKSLRAELDRSLFPDRRR